MTEIYIWCWDLVRLKELCGILMTFGHVALEVKGWVYGFYEQEGRLRGPGLLKKQRRSQVAKDWLDLYNERFTKRRVSIEACLERQGAKECKLPRPNVFVYPIGVPIKVKDDLYDICEKFRKEPPNYNYARYNCVHALVDLLKGVDIPLQAYSRPHEFRAKQLEQKSKGQEKKGIVWKQTELREAIHEESCQYRWLAV